MAPRADSGVRAYEPCATNVHLFDGYFWRTTRVQPLMRAPATKDA